MAAKHRGTYWLVLLLFLAGTASAQSPEAMAGFQQGLVQATTDSARWYYSLQLSAQYYRYNYDSALYFGNQSLAYANRYARPRMLANSLNTIGAIYQAMGEAEKALQYLQQALSISEANGIGTLSGNVLINLGVIHHERSDHARALYYLQKAYAIKSRLQDTTGIMQALSNMADVWMDQGNADSALHYNLQALRLLDQHPEERMGRSITLLHLGEIYSLRGDRVTARSYLEQSLALKTAIGDKIGASRAHNLLARLEREEGRLDLAMAHLQRALLLAQETSSKGEAADIYRVMAMVAEDRHDMAAAYQYLSRYTALRDSLTVTDRERQFAEMETRYQTGQKEAELARQQLVIERQQGRQRLLFFGTLATILALIGFFQFLRYRQRLRQREVRHKLALQQAESEKLRELDRAKSTFFANISHEFRTPLTLILGPVQQWISNSQSSVPPEGLELIRRNAARLLELVNQLLELSQLESGRLKLDPTAGDIAQVLRILAHTYGSMAEQAGIEYEIDLPQESIPAGFDRDKLEKIVGNLLSNAFKNTPAGGRVSIQASIKASCLHLTVTDTGRGIAQEDQEKIFERFYQVESREGEQGRMGPGSGIGLALVKELVQLHGGRISVESALGKGAAFRVELPFHQPLTSGEKPAALPDFTAQPTLPLSGKTARDPSAPGAETSLPLCLVVEDNPELQGFIREQLQPQFRILLAGNGREGLELAIEYMPDLIISDVMMPEMDGNQLCAALKTDERSSHIPVILLTARAGQESRIQGLETGADDYLTKPFDTRELLIRAQNLVQQRAQLRRQFSRTVLLKPKDIALTSADERFIQRVQETLDAQLSNEQFSVEDLAAAVGMSRSQLHRKLTALIDQPPVEFIRNFRLRRAKEMLEAGAGNVTEVCYEVGFGSPAYFSKAFKEAFGVSPSEARA